MIDRAAETVLLSSSRKQKLPLRYTCATSS